MKQPKSGLYCNNFLLYGNNLVIPRLVNPDIVDIHRRLVSSHKVIISAKKEIVTQSYT